MFDSTSRYYTLQTTKFTSLDGRTIAYVRRRFLPQGKDLPALGEVVIQESDRLDQLTTTTLGEPEQFWQIADANNAMNPVDLTAESGQRLRIPLPQV
ncbi:MAG: LysM domain-containing protein [Plectolyngbya sp. WJT66-NPBG17]|jgi:hypothetical protein|nr:LysM domain-containing protein [Plectolyngbya sp. WJT66-NPBG17]